MFADKVKKYSNGSVTIKILGAEAIPMPDAPAAAQRGTVDISNILMPFANALIPAADSIGRAEYDPAMMRKNNNPAYKYLTDGFAKVGLNFLGATSPSIPQYQTNFYLKKVATKLADLPGWKIASSGGANKAFIESLNMVCVPINFPDYFTAMERGTVDGYNVGTPGIQDFGLTPVTGCMLDETFSSCGSYMIMNMASWNKLSKDQQDVLTKAAIETEIDGIPVFDQVVAKVRDDISKAGVKITKLSHDESVKFYLSYRNAMWADDIKKFGDAASKMKEWLVDPNFARAK
jgi:TRAP-type transport system periplasmic protein